MLGDLRASLYDVFGYFLPGLVSILGIRLLYWATTEPSLVLSVTALENPLVLASTIVAAYIVGHLVHALGNQLWRTDPTRRNSYLKSIITGSCCVADDAKSSQEIDKAISRAFSEVLGIDAQELSERERLAILDESRAILPKDGDREVYIHRQGLYRGMAVATLTLIVGIASRLCFPHSCVIWSLGRECFSRWQHIWLICALVICYVGFVSRMYRFSQYQTERAMALGLIAMDAMNKGHNS